MPGIACEGLDLSTQAAVEYFRLCQPDVASGATLGEMVSCQWLPVHVSSILVLMSRRFQQRQGILGDSCKAFTGNFGFQTCGLHPAESC